MTKRKPSKLIVDSAAEFHRDNFGTTKFPPDYGQGEAKKCQYNEPTKEEREQIEDLKNQFDPRKNPSLHAAYRKALE